jgi:hypothetical protein
MATLFIDDGYPEAEEYENNYIKFDESDPSIIRTIIRQIRDCLKNRKGKPCVQVKCFNCSHSNLSA